MGATGPVLLASFSDANPQGARGDYAATIDWGDGTRSAGTITGDPGGPFTVTGGHTYAEEGTYAVSVLITDLGGPPQFLNYFTANANIP